jgi:hypothetical protein
MGRQMLPNIYDFVLSMFESFFWENSGTPKEVPTILNLAGPSPRGEARGRGDTNGVEDHLI